MGINIPFQSLFHTPDNQTPANQDPANSNTHVCKMQDSLHNHKLLREKTLGRKEDTGVSWDYNQKQCYVLTS